MVNRRLRQHVTRGFSLSLTHDHIRFLVGLHAKDMGNWATCAVAGQQLLARGLVGYATDDEPFITAAGMHVVGLLQLAGIYAEHHGQLASPQELAEHDI